MNKVTKYALIVFGSNVVIFIFLLMIANALGSDMEAALFVLLVVPILLVLAELVFGIVYSAGNKRKELGGGILIGLGVTLLIGLSACGLMMS